MRLNIAVPEAHVDAPVLDAALESVTRLNESMLDKNEIPSFERGLKYGVKWKPEPPGAEHFDHGREVISRGWGDCDDLAPWHAASLRHSGEDPGAKAIVKRSGKKMWHAVVQRTDGSIDDPSRRAGMGQPHEYAGATVPLMPGGPTLNGVNGSYIIRPQLALRPVYGGYQARTDLPWHYKEDPDGKASQTDYAMVSLHSSPVASTALVGAIMGAIEVGEAAGIADPEHVDRLCCIADHLEGLEHDELEHIYGTEHADAAVQLVGSFFGKLKNIASKGLRMAAPMASFVPGVGPIASNAIQHFIPAGGGGGAPHFPQTYAPGAAAVQNRQPHGRGEFTFTFG